MKNKSRRMVRAKKPYVDLIELQAERATDFKTRNKAKIAIFNHMLGYGFITRHFMSALNKATDNPETLQARVHISLETRFFNSIFASLRLTAFGMFTEANIVMRSAFEALQYFRLLYYDPSLYNFFDKKPLRPVEVRKKLEEIGHEIEFVRDIYSKMSSHCHVGGDGSLNFDIHDLDADIISIGGFNSPEIQDSILNELIVMMHLFQGFALGLNETGILEYFNEIRALLQDGDVTQEKTERFFEIIKKNQFSRS